MNSMWLYVSSCRVRGVFVVGRVDVLAATCKVLCGTHIEEIAHAQDHILHTLHEYGNNHHSQRCSRV